MNNPFEKIKERIASRNSRLAEEQRRRIERLQELEDAVQKKNGFHIPHPIKAMQNKKEIKQLRKEIEAYNDKKKNNILTIALVGAFVWFGIVGIIAEKNTENRDALSSAAQIETDALATVSSEYASPYALRGVSASADVLELDAEAKKTTDETEKNSELKSDDVSVQSSDASESEEADILKLTVNDLSVSTLNDYAHIDTETLYLGNGEGVTIAVETSVTGVTAEDILLFYDDDLLSAKTEDAIAVGNKTRFEFYVTGKSPCSTQIAIITNYDYLTKGDEVEGFVFDVNKLDSSEGRVCYVTPTGEKYHLKEKCAGKNAIKTTFRDAAAYEYEPCGKCAK